ncbi:RHS repeat domain-containing protein, partial [Bacteroides cellulosilyticus]
RTRHLRRYRWGKADRLLATEDSRRGTTRYGYTPNGQLEYAEYGDGTEQWRKSDEVGNLYPNPDCTVRRFLKGGAMEQDGKWHCEYDKDGNLTERYIGTGRWLDGKKEHWKYRWNADGSLAKVVRPDGEEVTFEYDALGRRLSKSFGTTMTRWMWNGNVPLHQWKQRRSYSREEGAWLTEEERKERTLWLFEEESFVPAAMIKEGKAYSILTDHLGTPTEAYDTEGNEVWSRTLDMNGKVIEETGNVGMIPFLFQGQYYDRETGLAYNRFRYYSPQMGMYVSQDPIRLAGGIINLYGYVDDANICIDLFGLVKTYGENFVAELKKKTNKREGLRRENTFRRILEEKYGKDRVLSERMLLDDKGNKRTYNGSGRRVDFVVLDDDGNAIGVYEVTSKTANKKEQMTKEKIIRMQGITTIRDNQGNLVEISNLPTKIIRIK